MVSDTPTIPWPPSSVHSDIIRSMALCRASYIAFTRGPNEPYPPRPETCVGVRTGRAKAGWAKVPYPAHAPGQPYPPVKPML